MTESLRQGYMDRVKQAAYAAAEQLLAGMSTVMEYLGDAPLGYEVPDSIDAMAWFLGWCDDKAGCDAIITAKMTLKGWDREAAETWFMALQTDFLNAIDERGGPDAVRYEQFLKELSADQKDIKAAQELVYEKPKVQIAAPQPKPDPGSLLTAGSISKGDMSPLPGA